MQNYIDITIKGSVNNARSILIKILIGMFFLCQCSISWAGGDLGDEAIIINGIRKIYQNVVPLKSPEISLNQYGIKEHRFWIADDDVVKQAADIMELTAQEWANINKTGYKSFDFATFRGSLAKSKMLFFGLWTADGCLKGYDYIFADEKNCASLRDFLKKGGVIFFDYYASPGKKQPYTLKFFESVEVSTPGSLLLPEESPSSYYNTIISKDVEGHPLVKGIPDNVLRAYGGWKKWTDRQIAPLIDKENNKMAGIIIQENVMGKGKVIFSQINSIFLKSGEKINRIFSENILTMAFGNLDEVRKKAFEKMELDVIKPSLSASVFDFTEKSEIRIPIDSFKVFEFPAIKLQPSERVIIEVECFLNYLCISTSQYAMKLELNGKMIEPKMSENETRLIDRSAFVKLFSVPGKIFPVFENGLYRVPLSPNNELPRDPYANEYSSGDDLTFFSFDVTDLLNEDKPSKLKIANKLQLVKVFESNPPELVLTELKVRLIPADGKYRTINKNLTEKMDADKAIFIKKIEAPLPALKTVPFQKAEGQSVPYEIEARKDGSFILKSNEKKIPVLSKFSYPNGGYNCFGPAVQGEKSESGFSVKLEEYGKTKYKISAKGQYYEIERTIELKKQRIEISDTYKNISGEDIGIIVNNYTTPGSLNSLFVTGERSGTKTNITFTGWRAMNNPTLFYTLGALGIGMVVLDDVYRVQASIYSSGGQAGISTESFALSKNGMYTMKWAIYPIKGEYFDFINLIRKDEDLNVKIEGPGASLPRALWTMPLEKLKNWVEIRSAKILIISTQTILPGLLIHGTEIFEHPEVLEDLKRKIKMLHEHFPDCKVLIYIEPSLNTDPHSPEKFTDSRVCIENGEQKIINYASYFSDKYKQKGYGNAYVFTSTPESSYHKALEKIIDLHKDLGADGTYIDDFMVLWNNNYASWDGYSAEIDKISKCIKRKYANQALQRMKSLGVLIKRVTDRGGNVVVNGTAGGSWELSKLKGYNQFIEAGEPAWYSNCSMTHLFPSPISLGLQGVGNFNRLSVVNDIREKLNRGTLYYYENTPLLNHETIVSRMYPITIEELHGGWIKGKERIITAKPGVYGWNNDNCMNIGYLYDAEGMLVPNMFLTTLDKDGLRTDVNIKETETAALVKIPVVAILNTAAIVNIIFQQYDKNAIQFAANSKGTININVSDGEFKIVDSDKYIVEQDAVKKIIKPKNGSIVFPVELNGNCTIRIYKCNNDEAEKTYEEKR